MTRTRGVSYHSYIGNRKCQCGEFGYMEKWYSYLGSYCYTIEHKRNGRTTKRCWLKNEFVT